MKIETNRIELANALYKLRKVLKGRGWTSNLQAFRSVRVKTVTKGIELSVNNLDIAVTVTLEADVRKHGEMVVEIDNLTTVTKKLKADTVTISDPSDLNRIELSAGSKTMRFNGMHVDDYVKDLLLPDKTIKINGKVYVETLAKCLGYTSTDAYRQNLMHAYIDVSDGLSFVATDGHRLVQFDRPEAAPSKKKEFQNMFVSQDTIKAFKDFYPRKEVATTLGFKDQTFTIEFANVRIQQRNPDITFPDYRQVIGTPKAFFGLDSKKLQTSNEMAGMFTSKSNMVRLSFSNNLEVYATDDGNEYLDVIDFDLDLVTDYQVKVGINHKYLSEALKDIGSDTVRIGVSDVQSPMHFRAEDNHDDLYIVMPMRLN